MADSLLGTLYTYLMGSPQPAAPPPEQPKMGANPHPLRDKIGDYLQSWNSDNFRSPDVQPAARVLGAVRDMVSKASDTRLGQAAQVGMAALPFIKAYHGSPYDFDKFDLSKIGTGEGAQAYGHGLYFAENPKVAQDYRGTLARPTPEQPLWRLNGEPVTVGTPNWELSRALQFADAPKPGQSMADVVNSTIDRLTDQYLFADKAYGPDTSSMYARHAATLGKIDPNALTYHRPGVTYEVGIHAQPEQLLDWDKPLSQQTAPLDTAKRYLSSQDITSQARDKINNGTVTGREFYHWLTGEHFIAKTGGVMDNLNQAPAMASEYLNDQGVPGIKYLDQQSRFNPTKDTATRNYVVFNDQLVDILKKYGIAGAAGAAPLMRAILGQQDQTKQ